MSEIFHLANKSIRELGQPLIPKITGRKQSKSVIDLYKNINSFHHEYSDYPPIDDSSLRDQYISSLYVDALNLDNVILTAGISNACELIFKTFLQPRHDIVAIATPTFELYKFLAKIFGIEILELNYIAEDFRLNLKEFMRLSQINAKVIFLCSPNNPTGQVISISIMKEIVESLGAKQLLVVDEAYIDFSDERSAISLIKDNERLIVMRTFSKAWGMAGLRLGGIISSKNIIDALQIAHLPFTISAPALNYLKNIHSLSAQMKYESKEIMLHRNRLVENLRQFSWLEVPCESHANFILITTPYAESLFVFLLKKYSIIVSNQTRLIPNALRISIGNMQNQKLLLSAFKEFDENLIKNKVGAL